MPDNHKKFEIFVDGNKIEVTQESLTGTQIKQLAGVPATDLLELLVQKHEPEAINDDQVVTIKSGLHFRTHPGGRDS
jgi:hypothetical protein